MRRPSRSRRSIAHPDHIFQIDGATQSIMGLSLPPRNKRKSGANEIQQRLSQGLSGLSGQKIAVFQPPSCRVRSACPYRFCHHHHRAGPHASTRCPRNFWRRPSRAACSCSSITTLSSIYRSPSSKIDRDKTAQLGLTMNQVGTALGSLLGGNYVNYFSMDTRSYKVIPQVERLSRLNTNQLLNYPVANIGGVPIPLSSIATIRPVTVPETLNHFQQLNSATLSGVMAAGVSLDDALKYLQGLAARTLPQGYAVDYGGQGRQFVVESGGIMATFAFAIIIVFLALAALFEAFAIRWSSLISVPLSIAGALIFIALGVGGASLNIYTEVGLVTLMGLISKHGILIVEVANTEQQTGKSKHAAVVRPPAPVCARFDDHRGHGLRRGAAGVRERCRRRVAASPSPRHLDGLSSARSSRSSWFRESTCS